MTYLLTFFPVILILINMKPIKTTYCFHRNSDGYYICYHRNLCKDMCDPATLYYYFPAVSSALVDGLADSIRIRWRDMQELVAYRDKYNNIIVRIIELVDFNDHRVGLS